MGKKVFWNGNGLSMLSETERKLVDHGDVCQAGTVTVVGDQMWLDGKHVIATIADPEEADKESLAERVRLADGGAPRTMSAAELAQALADTRRKLADATDMAARVTAQRDKAIADAQAKSGKVG